MVCPRSAISVNADGTDMRSVPSGTWKLLQTGNPARGALRIHGSTSQFTDAATRPRNSGFVLSHSKTLVFAFRILSLLLIFGSA